MISDSRVSVQDVRSRLHRNCLRLRVWRTEAEHEFCCARIKVSGLRQAYS